MVATAKERILNAATNVFAKDGYNGASIRKIADRANVNSAMISYYFKTKRNLYETILSLYLDEFIERIMQIKTTTVDDFLNEFVLAHMKIIKKRGEDVAFLTLREYVNNFKYSGKYLKGKTAKILSILSENLKDHVRSNINIDFLVTLIIFSDIGLSLKFKRANYKDLSDNFIKILLGGIK